MSENFWKTVGLSPSQIALSESLDAGVLASDPAKFWQRFCTTFSSDFPSPDVVRSIWDKVFESWNDSEMPRPMWCPSLQQIQNANISMWAADRQIHDFAEFHQWSSQSPEEFWTDTVERLEIQFDKRGDAVLDQGDDPAYATWFSDSRLNIVNSCFLAEPSSVAIIAQKPGEPIKSITYEQLRSRVSQVADGLVTAGFEKGDAIAVVLPMTAESVVIYLGIVAAGMSVVSIADSFAAAEIANRLRIADAKAVFTYDAMSRGGKTINLLERVQQATDKPAIVIPLNGKESQCELRDQDLTYSNVLSQNTDFQPVICESHEAINILFSSGTTGDPKAIPWTHLTPIKCAVDGHVHQNLHANSVAAWPTNLGWMMGPWLIFATLLNRGTIALYEDIPMGNEFGQFIADAKVTMLGVVPTIVKAWRTKRTMEDLDWSSIECFSSTGEASQADDMFYLSTLANMKPVIEYCGGTEIGGGYITSTVVQPNVAATFSTPAIGLGIELLDDDGNSVDDGQIFLRGPSLGLSERLLNRDHFKTYYEETPTAADGLRLRRHGDHMKRLPGGYFVAGGRADDTMNLGGIKISSAEIERVLNRIECVRESAAVASNAGGPDQLIVFAVLETSKPPEDLLLVLNHQIRSELNPLFKISELKIIDSMPRTASNKVMRRKLRDQLI